MPAARSTISLIKYLFYSKEVWKRDDVIKTWSLNIKWNFRGRNCGMEMRLPRVEVTYALLFV